MESRIGERHESWASQEPHEPQEYGWIIAAHLSLLVMVVGIPGFLGPLVVFLLKSTKDARLAAEAREAMNFGVSTLLYAVGLLVLAVVAVLDSAWPAVAAVALAGLILLLASLLLPLIATVRVASGEHYRYPLTIRFF